MTIDDPLPAPEPMDNPDTRPPLDLHNVKAQVISIQIQLQLERMRRDDRAMGNGTEGTAS